MGKIVYHWDDHRHSAFDDLPLCLTAIADNDSFYYSVSEQDGRPCALKGFESDEKHHFFSDPLGYLDRLISEDILLCADFTKTRIAVRGLPFVIVERRHVNEDALLQRLSQMVDLNVSDKILTTQIDDDLHLACAVPEVFIAEAKNWFSNADISHVMAGLICKALQFSNEYDKAFILLNISRSLTEMIVCRKGRLYFANHYRISGTADVLYYLLAVLGELQLDPSEIEVRCTGPAVGETIEILRDRIPLCRELPPSSDNQGLDFPAVQTADLMSVFECAS